MSMVLTRSPLEPIGMNGASGAPQRRSARLSAEGAEENEPPAKKDRVNGVSTTTVSTKEQDGDGVAPSKKKRKGKIANCCFELGLGVDLAWMKLITCMMGYLSMLERIRTR